MPRDRAVADDASVGRGDCVRADLQNLHPGLKSGLAYFSKISLLFRCMREAAPGPVGRLSLKYSITKNIGGKTPAGTSPQITLTPRPLTLSAKMPLKIAYLFNQYPRTAQAAMRREIVALDALGTGSIATPSGRPTRIWLTRPTSSKSRGPGLCSAWASSACSRCSPAT